MFTDSINTNPYQSSVLIMKESLYSSNIDVYWLTHFDLILKGIQGRIICYPLDLIQRKLQMSLRKTLK